ncbi:MAG: hypothetical protein ACXU8U_01305 [Asticcacaulis sp.]
MSVDPVMMRITSAIGRLQSGETDVARADLEAIWSEIAHAPNPLHECTLAHFMADLQDNALDELSWDLRALGAARRATDAEFQDYAAGLSVKAFLPSLYLNLADDYHRLGNLDEVETYLKLGQVALAGQPDTPYFGTVRTGLARIAEEIKRRP